MFSAIYPADLYLHDLNQYEDKIHLLLGSYCTNSYCVYSPRTHQRHNIWAKIKRTTLSIIFQAKVSDKHLRRELRVSHNFVFILTRTWIKSQASPTLVSGSYSSRICSFIPPFTLLWIYGYRVKILKRSFQVKQLWQNNQVSKSNLHHPWIQPP